LRKTSGTSVTWSLVASPEKRVKQILFFGHYNTLMIYNTQTNDWSMGKLPLEPPIMFGSYSSVAKLDNGSVLLIGGCFSSDLIEFNPSTLKVSLKTHMERPRTEHSSVHVNGRVYIMGGFEKRDNNFLSECEIYEANTNRFLPMAPMSCPKCGFSCASTEQKIYAVGGFNGKQRLKTIEVYDIQADKWQLLDVALPFGLTNSSLMVVNPQRLLVFGGG